MRITKKAARSARRPGAIAQPGHNARKRRNTPPHSLSRGAQSPAATAIQADRTGNVPQRRRRKSMVVRVHGFSLKKFPAQAQGPKAAKCVSPPDHAEMEVLIGTSFIILSPEAIFCSNWADTLFLCRHWQRKHRAFETLAPVQREIALKKTARARALKAARPLVKHEPLPACPRVPGSLLTSLFCCAEQNFLLAYPHDVLQNPLHPPPVEWPAAVLERCADFMSKTL